MGLPTEVSSLLFPGTSYQIERSVRLRRSASAYFNRTLTTPTLSTRYTLSFWLKRGSLSSTQGIIAARQSASPYELITFQSNDTLIWYSSNGLNVTTNAVFRDPSAWYHLMFVSDTTEATAANRSKLFVNGTQQTYSSAAYPAQNAANVIDSAIAHWIGSQHNGSGVVDFFDGYIAEVNFIDGQALPTSSFGYSDPQTGVWTPRRYMGTYGTNGYYLKFTDNSAATATTIGKDFSGNGNNWTPTNVSVTLGSTYDSMIDSPTNYADGGNGRGNYSTLNPLVRLGSVPLANANLQATSTGPNNATQSTIAMPPSSGKWYAEFQASSSTFPRVGVSDATDTNNNMQGSLTISWGGNTTGEFYVNGTLTAQSAGGYSTEIIGIAYDTATRRVWFSKNGVWANFSGSGADPATNTNPAGTLAGSSDVFFALRSESCTITANFGQRPFSYTPPTGFRALNTQNLPTPSIQNGAKYMDVSLFTGDGSNGRAITNSGMQPDFVWQKSRSTAYQHYLFDSVRGTGLYLVSNSTAAEAANSNTLISFNSNGYSINSGIGTPGGINDVGATFVGWQWKEGAVPGFDIVTYTGNGAASRSIAHSLGAPPKMMIVKWRGGSNNWAVGHTSLTNWNWYLSLNTTTAQTGDATVFPVTPDSSVFYVGSSSLSNGNTNGYVNYLWSEVPGFSRFGSYVGNGSSDGPFIWLGFRPAFFLVKASSGGTAGSQGWSIADNKRLGYNLNDYYLFANSAAAEGTGNNLDLVSNGVKLRGGPNENGTTYIYAAFAENPLKLARAR